MGDGEGGRDDPHAAMARCRRERPGAPRVDDRAARDRGKFRGHLGEQDRAWTYRIVCDGHGRTRSLVVDEVGGPPARSDLEADGGGHWRVTAVPELEGALDVDLSASPFTNTLPIRRLGLAIGRSAEIVAAYIAFPELDVRPRPAALHLSELLDLSLESLDEDFST